MPRALSVPTARPFMPDVVDLPHLTEVAACRPWLDAELDVVRPRVVMCLGATAAQALLGPKVRVTQMRGQFVEWDREPLATATVHPSSILRAEDPDDREVQFRAFVAD